MSNQVYDLQEDILDGDKEVPCGRPGIMVLSSLLRPLHMNRRAVTLLSDLVSATPEAHKPINRTGDLPPLLVDLAGKILSVLRHRRESAEKGQCEICYLADNSSKQVVIRCVGLPSRNGFEDTRIVFVLSDANDRHVKSDLTSMEMSPATN